MQGEDRAITQAKKLWADKNPREAVQVLIQRVNELNAQVATLQGRRESTKVVEDDARKWLRAFIAVILLAILAISVWYIASGQWLPEFHL